LQVSVNCDKDMTVTKYIEIIKKMYLAFNERDLDEWSKYFDENTLDFVPSVKEPQKSRNIIRKNNEQFLKTIPDAHYDLTNVFGQSNFVCAEGFVAGTNISSGKSFRAPFCIVVKFENDTIRERHWYVDQHAFQG